jgi:hypothetical protein
MKGVTINVRMGVKCAECRKGGAMDSGICLRCAAKAFSDKPMKSAVGQAVQRRMQKHQPR